MPAGGFYNNDIALLILPTQLFEIGNLTVQDLNFS